MTMFDTKPLIKYLLITLILSLGFGQLLRFDFYGIPLYVHDILVVILLSLLGLTCDWRSVLAIKRTFLNRRPEQSSSRDTEGGRRVLTGTTGIYVFLFALFLSSLRALTIYPLSSLLIPSLYGLRLLAYLTLYLLVKNQKIKIPPFGVKKDAKNKKITLDNSLPEETYFKYSMGNKLPDFM